MRAIGNFYEPGWLILNNSVCSQYIYHRVRGGRRRFLWLNLAPLNGEVKYVYTFATRYDRTVSVTSTGIFMHAIFTSF